MSHYQNMSYEIIKSVVNGCSYGILLIDYFMNVLIPPSWEI